MPNFMFGQMTCGGNIVIGTGIQTWVVPSDINSSVTIQVWGAGGGGASEWCGSATDGGGGGGGAFSSSTLTVSANSTYTLSVGVGGTAAPRGNGGSSAGSIATYKGGDGGDSWFGNATTVMAKGGKGGTAGTGNSASCHVRIYGTGGAGGQAASGFGTIKYNGGNGGTPNTSGTNAGGASSAGLTSNGANGSNNQLGGIAPVGGGDGGLGGESVANPGCSPGGGSGGADNSNPSALGGNGQVILKFTTTSCPTGIEIMYGGPQSVAMTSTSWKTICSGTSVNLPLTATTAAKFTWIATDNINITGESVTTQTLTTLNNILTNTTTTNQTITYTVTPTITSNSNCVSPGIPQVLRVVVIPKPMITNANVSICTGSNLNIPLTSNVPSSYTWIATNNPNTVGESTVMQNSSTITDILTNVTAAIQTVTYTVIPTSTSASCIGTTKIVNVTVIPSLTATVSPNSPATFTTDIALTASAGGGLPPYFYKWKNSLNVTIGADATYIATLPDTYVVEISDGLNISACNTFRVVEVNIAPLPIELLYFNVAFNDGSVDINWETASEINNNYFTVERSVDMVNFIPICVNIPSKAQGGNSTSILSYRLTDNSVSHGVYYYRLKQTDFNGKFKHSEIKMVEIKENTVFSFEISPNPCDGMEFSSRITSDKDKEIVIVVYDIWGQEKYSKAIITEQKGNVVYIIDLHQKLSSGVYLITATSEQKVYSKRVVVN